MSQFRSRLLCADAPDATLIPITGLKNALDLSLIDAIHAAETGSSMLQAALSSEGLPNMKNFVSAALAAAQKCSPEICQKLPNAEQRAAVHIYTQQSPLYATLNAALRKRDRREVVPFLPYLKLLHLALMALPAEKKVVMRGIRPEDDNLIKLFPEGGNVVFWALTSVTGTLSVLQNPAFLGTSGRRIQFTIETNTAVCVSQLSAIPTEDELLLGGGSQFVVKGVLDLGNDLHEVHLVETAPPIFFTMLENTVPPPVKQALKAFASHPTNCTLKLRPVPCDSLTFTMVGDVHNVNVTVIRVSDDGKFALVAASDGNNAVGWVKTSHLQPPPPSGYRVPPLNQACVMANPSLTPIFGREVPSDNSPVFGQDLTQATVDVLRDAPGTGYVLVAHTSNSAVYGWVQKRCLTTPVTANGAVINHTQLAPAERTFPVDRKSVV